MNAEEYRAAFQDPPTTAHPSKETASRAERALDAAIDIRKFEVDLYWKRATYFWAFIAAAFAGYALTYKIASEHDPWLSLLFTALGLVFSFAWYLVNRGSKLWQNNWERHVDLLEDMTIGPLYKVIAINVEGTNPLIAAGQFSVTKINQMLSLFVTLMWLLLFAKSLGPLSLTYPPDIYKCAIVLLTVAALAALLKYGRSTFYHGKTRLIRRTFDVESKDIYRNS